MPFGIIDTHYIDFPANVDVQYLQGLRTRAGLNFRDVIREIDDRLGAFNRTLDPLVAELVYPTTEPANRRGNVVAFQVNERGEYTVARPQLTKGQGHMLPIRGYDVAVGFTEDGLMTMTRDEILANIDSMLLGFRTNHRRQALVRLFSAAEVPVDDKTDVTSPGFAGSGTGANAFSGSYPNGQPLEGGFSLYYAADTAGGAAAALAAVETALDSAIARLRRIHGDNVVLDLQPSEPLIMILKGSAKFVGAGSALIRPAMGEAEARVDAEVYAGVYGTQVRVRHGLLDIQSAHAALFRAGTALSPNNILAWRYDELKGRNAYVRYRDFFPLSNAYLLQDFGIGVRDRTGAALIYAANGAASYTAPTFAF